MKSRRGTHNSGLEVSQDRTPGWRQMTITESFRNRKRKTFKMKEPIVITNVCHVIDSDSDTETPPQFESADMICENDSEPLLPDNFVMGAPSPPKRTRPMIGVYKPNTTPQSSPKKNVAPGTPRISSSPSPNGLSLKASPHSVGSNSSSETIKYQYQASQSMNNSWDEQTVPFAANDEFTLSNQIVTEENLIMNYEENAMDAFTLPINSNNRHNRPSITELNPIRPNAIKRLDFNDTSDNNARSKVVKTKMTPKKNQITKSVNQNKNSNDTKNVTDIAIPKKPRKRKNCSDGGISIVKEAPEPSLTNKGKKVVGNRKKIINPIKENSAPEQSVSKSGGEDVRTVRAPLGSSLKYAESIEHRSQIGRLSSTIMLQSKDGELPVLDVELLRKDLPNDDVAKKKDNLSGIIDKLHTNSELTVDLVPKESDISKNSNDRSPNIGSNSMRKNVSSPTGWISKPSVISSSSGVSSRRRSPCKKGQRNNAPNATPNKSIEENTRSQSITESQKNYPAQTNSALSEKAKIGLEKTPSQILILSKQSTSSTKHDTTTNKTSNAKPSIETSAKASVEANTKIVVDASDKIIADRSVASTSANHCSTPQKQKMSPNTPVKNSLKRRLFRSTSTGSPKRRASGSPNKGSPIKNREIKSIRSKEGKNLQVKQMDELRKLFATVWNNRHLSPLLNRGERDLLTKFLSMEDNKKYFLMKLFVWKRLWYNIFTFCSKAQIKYDDEKDIIDIFEYLGEEELVDTDYKKSCNLLELLNRLDFKKVKEIMEERKIKPIRSKEENIKTILTAASRQTTLTSKSFKDLIMDSIEKKMGFAIKIKEEVINNFYHAYLLATFANQNFYKVEDYFKSIVYDQVVFPETPVEDCPVFYSRDKFLNYGRSLQMRLQMEEEFAKKNRESKLMGLFNIANDAYEQLNLDIEDTRDHYKTPHLKRFTARHVYTGILSFCCDKMYTKNGHPKEVKKWLEYLIKRFPNSRRLGRWYEVLIRLHMRYLDTISFQSAAKVLIEALGTKKHALDDIAIYDLGELGRQLKSNKRHKIDQIDHDRITQIVPRSIDIQSFPRLQIDSQCIRSEDLGKKREYIVKSSDGLTVRTVEMVALAHYAQYGYPEGEHCEGSHIRALLMLFFWDIIYNPENVIPGIFISKLQTAPLDMFTVYFYENRRELIDKRLVEIDSTWSEEELTKFASDKWQVHSHEQSVFNVIMNVIPDKPMVEVLISVIGRKVLAKIFERILKHSREFRSGMPDLLVWNVDKKECKFVEVKGEGDKLSTKQKLWLQYLQQSGASIEVCDVHSMGSKRKKIKKVQIEKQPGHDEAGPSSRPDN